jgi:UDP-N-acetylmuramoyl-L-alanyl-D-glutamate--2,6-diaminopimelate ligase
MDQYRKDKSILFRMLRGRGTKVLSADDGSLPLLTSLPSQQTILWASHDLKFPITSPTSLLWITDIDAQPNSSTATVQARMGGREESHKLVLPIPGLFNLENGLCALACAQAVGVSLAKGVSALHSFSGVPGRMERISGPQAFTVYVDFTVTPVAYERTLSALRRTLQPHRRLLVLTGSCGDRMREKRSQVGRICSTFADVVVVTNEDPYTEDPDRIIEEVWQGIDTSKTHAHKIRDRLEAIRYIFSQAQAGDVVLLCGKGSDTTMMTKEGQIPWNEREIARTLLQNALGSNAKNYQE